MPCQSLPRLLLNSIDDDSTMPLRKTKPQTAKQTVTYQHASQELTTGEGHKPYKLQDS